MLSICRNLQKIPTHINRNGVALLQGREFSQHAVNKNNGDYVEHGITGRTIFRDGQIYMYQSGMAREDERIKAGKNRFCIGSTLILTGLFGFYLGSKTYNKDSKIS